MGGQQLGRGGKAPSFGPDQTKRKSIAASDPLGIEPGEELPCQIRIGELREVGDCLL
jgi:hypothetical protein